MKPTNDSEYKQKSKLFVFIGLLIATILSIPIACIATLVNLPSKKKMRESVTITIRFDGASAQEVDEAITRKLSVT